MAGLTVRPFEARDAPEIVSLHKKHGQWFEEPELTVDYVLQCSLRPDFRFFIAELDGTVVGYCGVLFYESVGRAELGPICTAEGLQNQGVGTRLLQAALKFLQEKNIHRITAKIKENNQAGIKLFEQNGFKKEAHLEKYTKKGESAIQMVKIT